jgi:hypothetical protein
LHDDLGKKASPATLPLGPKKQKHETYP